MLILFGLGVGDERVADEVVVCTVGCDLAPFGVLGNTGEFIALDGRGQLLGIGRGAAAQPSGSYGYVYGIGYRLKIVFADIVGSDAGLCNVAYVATVGNAAPVVAGGGTFKCVAEMQNDQLAGFNHIGIGAHPGVVKLDVNGGVSIRPLNGGGVYGLRCGGRGCGGGGFNGNGGSVDGS